MTGLGWKTSSAIVIWYLILMDRMWRFMETMRRVKPLYTIQLNVVLSESGEYSNVDSVMPIPKGFPAPESSTPPILWDMDNWSDEVFKTLPEWAQDKIKKSTQYQKEHTPTDSIEVKPQAEPAVPSASVPATTTGGAPF